MVKTNKIYKTIFSKDLGLKSFFVNLDSPAGYSFKIIEIMILNGKNKI